MFDSEFNVNSDLCNVKQYFDNNKRSLSVPKCQLMLIGTHQAIVKMADVRTHNKTEPQPFKHELVAKYFGTYSDSNLIWDDYIVIINHP